MKVKTYNLQHGWFSLTLPDDWDEYDDGDDKGTFVFFNSKNYSGNLRISPFHWENAKSNENKASEFIDEELNEKKDAMKIKLGKFDCVHYKKELVIYHWCIGENSDIYICSFTIDKLREQTDQHKTELEIVQDIIKSIV
jgi:hypothetical protein